MTIKYNKQITPYGECITKEDEKIISEIPMDESNSDYQRYLRWLENPDADESGTL